MITSLTAHGILPTPLAVTTHPVLARGREVVSGHALVLKGDTFRIVELVLPVALHPHLTIGEHGRLLATLWTVKS
jgi:hypothetical protein